MDTNLSGQENPLIWPLLSLLQRQPCGWKIHTLATALTEQNILKTLSAEPSQDLFKKNFLLMNGLYQLQAMLLPEQWLNVVAMDIRLINNHNGLVQITCEDPLRDYYLDWQHFSTKASEIDALLTAFWQRYRGIIGNSSQEYSTRAEDLALFGLNTEASPSAIRRQWRQLALRWHPDRPKGNADRFHLLCNAWQRLKP
ncbi:DNA-J related domain-containing protein [Photobacterium nomapromontoriensis]|uniref:DNA-J related domain-containing protein n=1 Tax=Photobacterium nomapromontoriensis TaxID=2910237 RepID=UPI003D098937